MYKFISTEDRSCTSYYLLKIAQLLSTEDSSYFLSTEDSSYVQLAMLFTEDSSLCTTCYLLKIAHMYNLLSTEDSTNTN